MPSMKIRQIELIGFKSFSEKTVLPLHEGITCIVGPNGCGKSNIVDAFRWVLGEQSAKSLRGEKMEEVIFQGSATKKPKAMAEVSLTLTLSCSPNGRNNGSNNTDVETEEEIDTADNVLVARRLYRSGASEYLLNNRVCRFKDIRDILLDTGLDVRSYSILDQHRITEIVNSKPLDRRFLIEEIAGVIKYKLRKAEAQSKLESSRQNLQRINDIILERRRQIGSLDRLAKKAERYKKLLHESQGLELRIARFRQSLLDDELKVLNNEIEAFKAQEASNRTHLSELQNKAETIKIELSEYQRAMADLEQLLQSKERELASTEKRQAVLKTQIENRKIELDRLDKQAHTTETRHTETLQKIDQIKGDINALQDKIEDLSIMTQGQSAKLALLLEGLREREKVAEDHRRDIFRLSDEVSTKRNELNKRLSHLEHLDYREEVALKDRENLTKTIESLKKTISEMEAQLNQLTAESGEIDKERRALIEAITNKEGALSTFKGQLATLREALASEASRLDSIRELFTENDVISIIKASTGSPIRHLSDLIVVDKGYETAIEALLAEKTSSPVLEDREGLLQLVSILKERTSARTSLLYKGFKPTIEEEMPLPQVEGLIGRASDFIVPFHNGDEAVMVIKNELSKAFIIDRIEPALEYIEGNGPLDVTFVTLQGDVITSKGWVFTGKGTEVLRFKREERELEASIKAKRREIEQLEDSISTLSATITDLKQRVLDLQGQLADRDKRQSILRHRIDENKKDLQRRQRRLESLEFEFASLRTEKDGLKAEIERMGEEIRQRDTEREALQQTITLQQTELTKLRELIQIERDKETALRLESTTLSERLGSAKRELQSLEALSKDFTKTLESIALNRDRTLRLIEEDDAQRATIETKIKGLITEITGLRAEYQRQRDTIAGQMDSINALEDSMKGLRAVIDKLLLRLTELNNKAVEKRLVKENIEKSIMERYGIDLYTVELPDGVSEEDEARLRELQERIREMGPVSLESITEYEELKRDYDFLVKQQEDLTLSITELEEAINRINATTKRRLREAYNALRERFNSVFCTLFGGGRADLLLTDEDNILESGIEIVAQPPGKKNQGLNQLSGGEKALTSLALLFAGFLIKPSPLCILDEADAPLDESNTERFTAMIKDLAKDTQFIIITHNRVTMEIADYLYGITMEEPGVSKPISLQFADYDRVMS